MAEGSNFIFNEIEREIESIHIPNNDLRKIQESMQNNV